MRSDVLILTLIISLFASTLCMAFEFARVQDSVVICVSAAAFLTWNVNMLLLVIVGFTDGEDILFPAPFVDVARVMVVLSVLAALPACFFGIVAPIASLESVDMPRAPVVISALNVFNAWYSMSALSKRAKG